MRHRSIDDKDEELAISLGSLLCILIGVHRHVAYPRLRNHFEETNDRTYNRTGPCFPLGL